MYLCGQCHIQWDTPYYDKTIWCNAGQLNQGDYLGTCDKLLNCPDCTNDSKFTIDNIAYPSLSEIENTESEDEQS
jgi:hypothetical protein